MSETPVTNLRKADFWTSLVLVAITVGMLLSALSMPLEGTYAGIKNSWYVSPALFPIIVAVSLLVLAGILLANAIRTGGARAALHDLRHPQWARFWSLSEEFWVVSGILAAYIYILVPRIDFIAATVLLLFILVATFDLGSLRAARCTLAFFVVTTVLVGLMALLGFEPQPRSSEAYWRDGLVWAVVALSMITGAYAIRSAPEGRARLARCLGVSILTPLILGSVFKYGLLVPLPSEGLTVEIMDRIRYGVQGLL